MDRYNFKIVEDFTRENYEEGDKIKSKNYCENNKCSNTEYNYKNNMEVYKGKCGTKSTFGTISDKLDQKPHLSEFVKNNIIGARESHRLVIELSTQQSWQMGSAKKKL